MKKFLFSALFYAAFTIAAAEPGFKMEYHFDEPDFSVIDSGRGKYHAVFQPAASRDQDQNEVTDVKNYRKKGVSGNSLFFKREYGSFACTKTAPAPFLKPQKRLLIRLYVNIPNQSGFQYILGNKSDSAKGGFSLLKTGHQWRFNFSDGKEHYRLEYPSRIPDGEWGLLEIVFDHGTVTLKENGLSMISKKFPAAYIAPNGTKLHFGNYVTANKKVYPCNGGIDELLISSDPASAISVQKVELKTINAICEPVDGAENFYGGVKTLHTFKEFPVPVSFLLGYAGAKSPSLELTLPDGVAIRDSFNGNHNKPDQQYKFIQQGNVWHLAPGSLHPDWTGKFPEKVVVALTVPENFTAGTVKWQVKDGVFTVIKPAELNKILPPKVVSSTSGGWRKTVNLPNDKGGLYNFSFQYRGKHEGPGGACLIVQAFSEPGGRHWKAKSLFFNVYKINLSNEFQNYYKPILLPKEVQAMTDKCLPHAEKRKRRRKRSRLTVCPAFLFL